MRRSVFAHLVFGTLALVTCASVLPTSAAAHEEHQMECDETSINAMNADIQSMSDGEAKATAMKEMQMAEDMMSSKDMKGCVAHMHNAMETMEK
ncbi:MAG: hypothetical protein WED13_04780 [Methyloceanibacter sp.]